MTTSKRDVTLSITFVDIYPVNTVFVQSLAIYMEMTTPQSPLENQWVCII